MEYYLSDLPIFLNFNRPIPLSSSGCLNSLHYCFNSRCFPITRFPNILLSCVGEILPERFIEGKDPSIASNESLKGDGTSGCATFFFHYLPLVHNQPDNHSPSIDFYPDYALICPYQVYSIHAF